VTYAEIRTGEYLEVTIDRKFSTEIGYKMHINYVWAIDYVLPITDMAMVRNAEVVS